MDDASREQFLIGMDTLADKFVVRALPVRFAVATAPHELEAIWRLRARVVLEREWCQPEDLPGGIERDEYDDRAVHIVGWDGESLAATARIVFPSPGKRLPTEEHFDLTAPPGGQAANLDRFIVARGYSEPRRRVLVALAFRSWLELRAHDFHLWIGAVTPGIIRLYRRLGWQVTQVGPGRLYWGEERLPCIFDPFEAFLPPSSDASISDEEWTMNRHLAPKDDPDVSPPG